MRITQTLDTFCKKMKHDFIVPTAKIEQKYK